MMNRCVLARVCAGLFLFSLIASSSAWAQALVRYQVRFDATWSATSHPVSYPSNPHFSRPIGTVHNDDVVFWQPGGLASPGIKSMAETGAFSIMTSEINAAAAAGNASSVRILGGGLDSPGFTTAQFTTVKSLPLVSLVTMIAPSPDWFAGVGSMPLFHDGHWRDDLVVDLYGWDAGTDSGASYTSANAPTVPQMPIYLLTGSPTAPDGELTPFGTYTFTILNVDGRPPYDDADSDGLNNLQEAELGTNPLLPDTDLDGINDIADNCGTVSNGSQVDLDLDGHGDACDNCPSLSNSNQADGNGDGEGDRCDLNDGALWFTNLTPSSQHWQDESGVDAFHLYRGDLNVLVDQGIYSQDPASPQAAQFCGLSAADATDATNPNPGEAFFFLVTSSVGGSEGSLGESAAGSERPNLHPCGS